MGWKGVREEGVAAGSEAKGQTLEGMWGCKMSRGRGRRFEKGCWGRAGQVGIGIHLAT